MSRATGMNTCVWSSTRCRLLQEGGKSPFLSKWVPYHVMFHYICTAWCGWDGTTPNYRQTQYNYISAFIPIIFLTPHKQDTFLFVALEEVAK